VEVFALLREPELTPRFNIALTSQAAGVRQVDKHRESMMRLWLNPIRGRESFAKRRRLNVPNFLRVAPDAAGRRGTAQIPARAGFFRPRQTAVTG
jgi:hypothetical protein